MGKEEERREVAAFRTEAISHVRHASYTHCLLQGLTILNYMCVPGLIELIKMTITLLDGAH